MEGTAEEPLLGEGEPVLVRAPAPRAGAAALARAPAVAAPLRAALFPAAALALLACVFSLSLGAVRA
jgi:hypothetical protein